MTFDNSSDTYACALAQAATPFCAREMPAASDPLAPARGEIADSHGWALALQRRCSTSLLTGAPLLQGRLRYVEQLATRHCALLLIPRGSPESARSLDLSLLPQLHHGDGGFARHVWRESAAAVSLHDRGERGLHIVVRSDLWLAQSDEPVCNLVLAAEFPPHARRPRSLTLTLCYDEFAIDVERRFDPCA
jgi:hypothetical protein